MKLPAGNARKRTFGQHGHVLLACAIAIAGGLAAHAANFPAGLLAGAMVSVAVAALVGVPVAAPDILRRVAFLTVGATIGASVSQETLASLPSWPVSLAALALSLVALMFAGPFALQRVFGYDHRTAVMACVPGAFSFVLAFSDETGADTRRVAIIQTMRLAGLFVAIPLILGATATVPTGDATLTERSSLPPLSLITLLAAALVGAWICRRIGVAAPEFIGAMLGGMVLSASGVIDGAVPLAIAGPAFIATGLVIGVRFANIDRALFLKSLAAGVMVFALSSGITASAAIVTAALLGEPFGKLWLAMAPGGLDSMAALALALGHDPAFVAGHQVLRFLGLSFVLPIILRRAL
ncbi:MAG: AbrB family transcriptional regulator [Pseudomonadota bacterium]